jgi:hypothetical protein
MVRDAWFKTFVGHRGYVVSRRVEGFSTIGTFGKTSRINAPIEKARMRQNKNRDRAGIFCPNFRSMPVRLDGPVRP